MGINFEPLREKISVRSNDDGDVEIIRELFTPLGQADPRAAAVPAARI